MNDSKKTTFLGVLGAIAAISGFLLAMFDGNPDTIPNLSELLKILGIGALGGGLVFARGQHVSDEQAGAGKK